MYVCRCFFLFGNVRKLVVQYPTAHVTVQLQLPKGTEVSGVVVWLCGGDERFSYSISSVAFIGWEWSFILRWYFFTVSLHGLVFVFTRHLIDFLYPHFPFLSVCLCLWYQATCRRWLCMMLIVDYRWYPFFWWAIGFVLLGLLCEERDVLLDSAPVNVTWATGVISFFPGVLVPVSSASPYAHVGAHTLSSFVPHSLCKQVFRI